MFASGPSPTVKDAVAKAYDKGCEDSELGHTLGHI